MGVSWVPYSEDQQSGHQEEASRAAEPHRRSRIPVAFRALEERGGLGLTWRELAGSAGLHHGQASGALSNLHRSGVVARLQMQRGGCGVYVLQEHVNGRPTVPYRRNTSVLSQAVLRLDALYEQGYDVRTLDAVAEMLEQMNRRS